MTHPLGPFTPAEHARLLIEREAVRRGLRGEWDQVEAGQPWACRRDAAYVGPPSVRLAEVRR